MSLKMAVIGMGGMANWHFDNIGKYVPEIKVAAGYDIEEKTNNSREKDWGIKKCSSPEEIYNDKSIDIVLIATPNDSHKDYIINLLNAGKHVICEKPVTMNAKELEEVIEVHKKSNKLFTVHQNRRWDPDYLIIKKILEEKQLSAPYLVESRVHGSKRLWGWRAFLPNGGGILLDWGVHLLDQMLDLIPHKITSVYGHLYTMPDSEIDDGFTAMLRFEDGTAGVIDIQTNNFIVGPRWHMSSADGTAIIENWECEGKIVKQADPNELDWTETTIYTAAGPTRTMLPRPKETVLELDLPKPEERMWTHFYRNVVDVLNGKAEQIVTPNQALRVMKVIDAIFESHKTSKSINEVI